MIIGMRVSIWTEWAVQCCVMLSEAERPVPAHRLAQLHGISPTYLSKHLQHLARAGLVRSSPGRTGGYLLTRSAAEITVLDVVLAMAGDEAGPAVGEISHGDRPSALTSIFGRVCHVAQAMRAAEHAWRASLEGVSLAEL